MTDARVLSRLRKKSTPRVVRPFNPAHPDFSPSPEFLARELARSEWVSEMAELLPAKPAGSTGRPRDNPELLTAWFWCTLGAFKSHRAAASFVRDPDNWKWLQNEWAPRGIVLNDTPPARKTLERAVRRLRPLVEALLEKFRELALAQARRQECLTGTAESATRSFQRGNTVIGDGTVPKARMKPETAKRLAAIPNLRDRRGNRISIPEYKMYKQGDNTRVGGQKFYFSSVRAGNEPNDRIFLDIRLCPGGEGGDEGAVATASLLDLRARCSQMFAVVYDGGIRGVHISQLMQAGLVVIAPPGKGHEAARQFGKEPLKCSCRDGSHVLYTQDGWLCTQEILDTGKPHIVRLDREFSMVKNPKNGIYRPYLKVTLPCGNTFTMRLDNTPKTDELDLNVAERIRQFPPGTPEYERMYPWRPDIESGNNTLDQTHFRNRIIADKAIDQHLILIAFAITRNVLSEAVYKARTAAPPQAAAA
jgi:hypothetical protein